MISLGFILNILFYFLQKIMIQLNLMNYQKEHKLSNSTVAKYFKVSRNSISKWKKMLNL